MLNTDDRDKRLVQECLAGNTAAFGGLIDKYEKLLFNIALRMVNNYDDARDITQTAFLKAYERLDSYDPRYKFFSWIYRIVVNESINAKTKAKRFTELDRDIPLHDRNPEQALVSDELSSKVQDAVVQLPPDYREVIILRHFAHMSYRDMSGVLEIAEKTVKSRLYTARKQLGEILLRKGVTSS